ncbi:MAG: acyltransferase [Actinobacteria bacterium]|nr:acyltransferase [Actinomycetota bacterium]
MAPVGPGRLARIAGATPASRDRVVDLVRAGSILVVVFGHWLVASVERRHGELVGTNALGPVTGLRPVTWIVQVIALFFLVGGFSNARALAARPGRFLAGRAERLLRPTIVFCAVWLVLAALLTETSVERGLVHDATRIAAQPL